MNHFKAFGFFAEVPEWSNFDSTFSSGTGGIGDKLNYLINILCFNDARTSEGQFRISKGLVLNSLVAAPVGYNKIDFLHLFEIKLCHKNYEL